MCSIAAKKRRWPSCAESRLDVPAAALWCFDGGDDRKSLLECRVTRLAMAHNPSDALPAPSCARKAAGAVGQVELDAMAGANIAGIHTAAEDIVEGQTLLRNGTSSGAGLVERSIRHVDGGRARIVTCRGLRSSCLALCWAVVMALAEEVITQPNSMLMKEYCQIKALR